MIKQLTFTIIAVALVAAGLVYYLKPKSEIDVERGRIDQLKSMVQLCTVDIYREVPVLDTIGSKVIFAVQKQRGSVSFDIEHLEFDPKADTITVVLPPEIVEIYESTEDNSWQVIDTKNLNFIGYDRVTDEEERAMKNRLASNSKRLLYANGVIAKARAEAADNLESLLRKVYRKPVMVVDPTPKGRLQ